MHTPCSGDCCHRNSCPTPFVCHCLEVTEHMVVEAITVLGIDTLPALRQQTGAGGGCNACHKRLRRYLEQYTGPGQTQRVPMPVVG